MIINETPIKTCVHYGINNFNLKDLKREYNKTFTNVLTKNLEIISNKAVKKVNNILSEEMFEESLNFCNFNYSITPKQNALLQFNFDKNNKYLIGNIEINLEKNSCSNLVVKFESEIDCYNNTIINVNGYENSKLNLIIFSNLKNCENLITINQNLQNNCNIQLNIVDFSNNTSVYNIYSNQNECSNSKVNCVYLENENAFLDLNIHNDIYGKQSVCDINCVGVLKDKAKKNFKGTITFEKGCKKSKGNENEFCILLSKDVRSKALPMLLCLEDDVEGNHSTSVGKIDDKQMFYLMARGLSYSEALRLIIKTKISVIMDNINSDIQNEIIEIFDRKLDLWD